MRAKVARMDIFVVFTLIDTYLYTKLVKEEVKPAREGRLAFPPFKILHLCIFLSSKIVVCCLS